MKKLMMVLGALCFVPCAVRAEGPEGEMSAWVKRISEPKGNVLYVWSCR